MVFKYSQVIDYLNEDSNNKEERGFKRKHFNLKVNCITLFVSIKTLFGNQNLTD